MASITHKKTNAITDWTQAQLDSIIAGNPAPLPPAGTTLAEVTLPSDWNDEHDVVINWGDITGTITDQTDLINYIGAGYVPYTGATANVNIGAFALTADSGTFANGLSADFGNFIVSAFGQVSAAGGNFLVGMGGEITGAALQLYDANNFAHGSVSLFANKYQFLDSVASKASVQVNNLELWDAINNAHGNLYLDTNVYWFDDHLGQAANILIGQIRPYDTTALGYGTITLLDGEYIFSDAGGGSADIIGAIGSFDEGLTVATISGLFLHTDYNTDRFGIGTSIPAARTHQHIASATAHENKFTNSSTGLGVNDGFAIGIGSTGVGIIRQYETNQIQMYVANTVQGLGIESNGKVTVRNQGLGQRGVITALNNRMDTVGNVGVGEDDLYTLSTPSSTLTGNGDCLEFTYTGMFAANANNKHVRAYFGAQVLFDTTALALNGGTWHLTIRVFRVTTTTFRSEAIWQSSNVLLPTQQTYTAFAGNALITNIVKITGQATADNDITAVLSRSIWIPII